MKSISVYCASSQNLEPCFHEAARIIGKGLANRNVTLVYGGGCIGLMGEVATVAAEHGGEVVGVITHKLVAHEQANEKCDDNQDTLAMFSSPRNRILPIDPA